MARTKRSRRVDGAGTWIDVTPLASGGVAVVTLRGASVVAERMDRGVTARALWAVNVSQPAGARCCFCGRPRMRPAVWRPSAKGRTATAWLTREGTADRIARRDVRRVSGRDPRPGLGLGTGDHAAGRL